MNNKLTIEDGYLWYNGISKLGISPHAFSYNSKYNFATKKWETLDRIRLCRVDEPFGYAMTTNGGDRYIMKVCERIGAKAIYKRDNVTIYDTSPSGRSVPRWTCDKRIYDLRPFVGCTKPLEEVLPYEMLISVQWYQREVDKAL